MTTGFLVDISIPRHVTQTQIFHLNAELSSRSFLNSPYSGSLRGELRLYANHSEKDRPSRAEHILRVNTDDSQRPLCQVTLQTTTTFEVLRADSSS